MTTGIGRRRVLAAGGVGVAGVLASGAPASASTTDKRIHVETGLDRLAASDWAPLRGQRIGVISNPTGVDRQYRHLVDLMHAAGLPIGGVFGPEHGFRGSAQGGGSEGTGVDARTGLTVSTHTARAKPRGHRCTGEPASTPSCSTSRTWVAGGRSARVSVDGGRSADSSSACRGGRAATVWRYPGQIDH